jgi:WD40 repeat protein
MFRTALRSSFIALILLFVVTSSQAQTVSRCHPSPPLPRNPKPGVIGLSLSRDGKTLLAAGSDGVIRVWDLASGEVKRTLTGHTNSIYKAQFSPNEKLIASSSRDMTARIWDFATGRELHKLTGFRCAVKSVVFSPNGKMVAAVGNDGMLKLWDVKTGRELKSLVHSDSADVDTSVYSVVFSREGKKLAFSDDYRLLASNGNNEATVKLWDVATKRELRAFAEQKTAGLLENSHVVAISPNQKMIAASVAGIDEKRQQYAYVRTYVWDVETGKKLFTLEGHKFDVGGLVFTHDNRYLLTGSADRTIKIYDLQTGKETRTLTQPPATGN